MTYKFFLAGIFIAICSCKTSQRQIPKKIVFVGRDYGILSVQDKVRPYRAPVMWRCFPIKDVQVKYHSWRDADPMGPYDVIVTMCNFMITVRDQPYPHIYSSRRGKEVTYCNEFKTAWDKITKGEKYICLDGETLTKGEPEEDKDLKKKIVSWTWDKIKTKKGCYSYWDGYACADF